MEGTFYFLGVVIMATFLLPYVLAVLGAIFSMGSIFVSYKKYAKKELRERNRIALVETPERIAELEAIRRTAISIDDKLYYHKKVVHNNIVFTKVNSNVYVNDIMSAYDQYNTIIMVLTNQWEVK